VTISVVILAAGQGKRMRSSRPKVLHRLADCSLLEHVYRTARGFAQSQIHIVYGHGGDAVREALGHLDVHWVEQPMQLGTGHALMQALPGIPDDATVLVLYGDVPLISLETLTALVGAAGEGVGLLTVELEDPAGYGRIVRDTLGNVRRIVEEKDATRDEIAIREVNTGMMAAPARWLRTALERLGNNNAQGEYYLTDVIEMAVADGVAVNAVRAQSVMEVMGVNDRAQLATLERHYQLEQARALMLAGITFRDPARFDLRGSLQSGQDVVIDVNVVLEGAVKLGHRVSIGPNAVIRDAEIGDDVEILANCVIEDAVIGAGARIGPYSRLRPQTRLAAGVHIGNFVEIKKSNVGEGSKINHLSYVGDAEVGRNVNIGAGTITCNYDGASKHRTTIGDDAFIGSDTQLVAPVTVGAGATLGAGTTLAQDAPPGKLTLSRAPQVTVERWQRPTKKPK
jgi:bifunctional UDP-N-acetylglucosamine pyrophosphorylase/glucosamine-1-phosphate N-acetyltransferase